MNKNAKVIEIYAHTCRGTFRTIHAAVELDVTIAEMCEERGIPMLAVIHASETEPMTVQDALAYSICRNMELTMRPGSVVLNNSMEFHVG